jgi:hypothetical protein
MKRNDMSFTLEILNGQGDVLQKAEGGDEVFLVYRQAYQEGDVVRVTGSPGSFTILALDDAMAPSLVFLKGDSYTLTVPFGPRAKTYSPRAFKGEMHRISVRLARREEIRARRDMACNPYDDHSNGSLFPHASANVETRGEAVFAARNAIDGEIANDDHGFWPYTSWGINQDPDAALTVEFGRPIIVDEIALTIRADFPHDAWWTSAQITFSDGSRSEFSLQKKAGRQAFPIAPRAVDSLRLHDLVKADDPSPFPALTRIEVMGREP